MRGPRPPLSGWDFVPRHCERLPLSAATSDPGFSLHLHVHSSYSLLEGALFDRAAGRARQGRIASPRLAPDRHRQHVSGRLRIPPTRNGRPPGIQPIVGLRARGSISATRTTGARPGRARQCGRRATCRAIVLLAAREEGYRNLNAAQLAPPFLGHAGNEPPARQARLGSRGACEGLNRAHRRAGAARSTRAIVAGPAAASPPRAGRGRSCGCSATGFMSSCSATAPPRKRGAEAALIEFAYARGPSAGRRQRAGCSRPADDYEAHGTRLICIAEGPACWRSPNRRHLTPEHRFQDPAPRMMKLFRRSAPRRSPPRSRSRGAAPSAPHHPRKPILPQFTTGRRQDRRGRPSCARRAEEGARAGASRRTALPMVHTEETIRERLALSSSMSSPG